MAEAEEAEALALTMAVEMLPKWQDRRIQLQSDCSNLVSKINDAGIDRSAIHSLVYPIRRVLGSTNLVSCHYVPRGMNWRAHNLAKWGERRGVENLWTDSSIPDEVGLLNSFELPPR